MTSGLLTLLDEAELASVLAHELAHIANRDVVMVTLATFFASIAAFIARIGARRDGGDPARVAFPAMVASGLVWLLCQLVVGPLSRERELAADRVSAIITGAPLELAAALERIAGHLAQAPAGDPRHAGGELAALAVLAPDATGSVATMFATHPPLAVRLDALDRLSVRYSSVLG